MTQHEQPSEFGPDSGDSFLPAEEQIRRFNAEHGSARNLSGWGEEIAQCSRIVKTMVRTESLDADSLTAIFNRAHESIPMGSTYLLAYRVIEEAAKTGKLTAETLGVVEQSVMADKDPLWSALDRQEEHNTSIMQQLLTNQHLFELMLPFISPEEFSLNDSTDV